MKEEIFIDAQLCAIILPAGYDESGIRFFTLNAASVNIHAPRARCVLGARMCLSLTQIKVWANAAAAQHDHPHEQGGQAVDFAWIPRVMVNRADQGGHCRRHVQ